jgi:amino-acid N-acetyltransferase
MVYKIVKPSSDDINQIYDLIKSYSSEGIILERTKEDIAESSENFLVAKTGEIVIGVVSYYNYAALLKEIRSLSVSKPHLHHGIGRRLLISMINEINNESDIKIFVLTYSPEFFKKNGFAEVDRETLPEKIWKDCNNCKNKDHCEEIAMVFTGQGA